MCVLFFYIFINATCCKLIQGVLRRVSRLQLRDRAVSSKLDSQHHLSSHEQFAQEFAAHYDRHEIQNVAFLRSRRVHCQDGNHARLSEVCASVRGLDCEACEFDSVGKRCAHSGPLQNCELLVAKAKENVQLTASFFVVVVSYFLNFLLFSVVFRLIL